MNKTVVAKERFTDALTGKSFQEGEEITGWDQERIDHYMGDLVMLADPDKPKKDKPGPKDNKKGDGSKEDKGQGQEGHTKSLENTAILEGLTAAGVWQKLYDGGLTEDVDLCYVTDKKLKKIEGIGKGTIKKIRILYPFEEGAE